MLIDDSTFWFYYKKKHNNFTFNFILSSLHLRMVACVAVIEELFVDSRLFSGRVWPSLRSHKDCLDHLTLTSAVQISIRKLFNIVATSLNQARCTIAHLLRVSKTEAFPTKNRHKKTHFFLKQGVSFIWVTTSHWLSVVWMALSLKEGVEAINECPERS